MNTKRGRKAAVSDSPAASMLHALKFISIAQKKSGTTAQQFCFMRGHWVAATNEIITVATKIEEDLEACPHTTQLIDALNECGKELSITQISQETIAVKSGDFRAIVSCIDPSQVYISSPDPQIAVIDDRLKPALLGAAILPNEAATNAAYAAVLLQAGSCVGTNGSALLEVWHGLDLPPGLLLPKASAKAIGSSNKTLSGFGYSVNSATFYYSDGSFIKTQLFEGAYPNYKRIFEEWETDPIDLPQDFFKCIKAIENFSKEGIVYFDKNLISSHEETEEATTYQINSDICNMSFSANLLCSVQEYFVKGDFIEEAHKVFFYGENARGCIMGFGPVEKEQSPVKTYEYDYNKLDDITF